MIGAGQVTSALQSATAGWKASTTQIVRRAYGFHTADATLALVVLGAGPINLGLPHEHPPAPIEA